MGVALVEDLLKLSCVAIACPAGFRVSEIVRSV